MPRSVVVLGVFVADATFRTGRLPRMGETVLGRGFALGPGGKGSNQAVAAARAGADTVMLTRLGCDTFAEMARETWRAAGVRADTVEDPDSYTGAACILLDDISGNNAIVVAPGAAARITPRDVDGWADRIAAASVFLTQLEQPLDAAIRGLTRARAAGAVTILNPAPAQDLPDGVLSLCDFVTPNESEAEALTGIPVTDIDGAKRAGGDLVARGAGTAIVTLGEHGVVCHDGSGAVHHPVLAAGPVAETTGAGDAFNGGLAAALAGGLGGDQAIRYGIATACLSVTRHGAAQSMPSSGEIAALLTRHGLT